MIRMLAALLIALSTVSGALAQSPNRDTVISLVQQIFTSEAMEPELRELGFAGENLDLAKMHIDRLYASRAVAGYVADTLIAAGMGTPRRGMETGGFMQPLIDRGMLLVPVADQRFFMRVDRTVLQSMGTADCGRAIKNTINPARLSERSGRVVAQLNAPALRRYYEIQRRAIDRALAGGSVRTLSYARSEEIREMIAAGFIDRVQNAENGRQLRRATANMNRVSNRVACEAGILFLDTILDFDDRDFRDALLVINSDG